MENASQLIILIILHALVVSYQRLSGDPKRATRGGGENSRWRGFPSAMSTSKGNEQVIKKAIAFRAKYMIEGGGKVLAPGMICPHPGNRSGDPVRSLRTKQLSSSIVADGCDVIEAESCAVCVEEHPRQAEGQGIERWESFQVHFEEQVAVDSHMARKVNGTTAKYGSLSHSHFNCLMRNILEGVVGCECIEGNGDCKCKNQPLLDEQGRYSMKRLEAHDRAWAELCYKGITWEVLSHRLDVEEPDGAKIISLALNKKNDAAMKTSHTEIMKALVSLCKPSPDDMDGRVPFEPVRDKMVEWYGSGVDHPDFIWAFRVVLDAGGHDSPHMQDLHQFTTAFVNPMVRKMNFKTYKVVAAYPVEFPRIKNACIKWSWRQTPENGWCPLPPSISDCLRNDDKNNMYPFMCDIEVTFRTMSKCVLTVVGQKDARKRAGWLAKVEIGVMVKIFADKKDKSGTIRDDCMTFLATKLVEMVDGDKHRLRDVLFPRDNPRLLCANNEFVTSFFKLAVSDHFKPVQKESKKPPAVAATSKKTSAVAEPQVPTVTRQDADGVPVVEPNEPNEPNEVPKTQTTIKDEPVEVIPWERWLASQYKEDQHALAKSVLITACNRLNANIPNPTIAMVRKVDPVAARSRAIQWRLYVKASQDIDVHELVIPLQFKKVSSLVLRDACPTIHPHAVQAFVSWPVSEEDKLKGIEKEIEDC